MATFMLALDSADTFQFRKKNRESRVFYLVVLASSDNLLQVLTSIGLLLCRAAAIGSQATQHTCGRVRECFTPYSAITSDTEQAVCWPPQGYEDCC
jgi:hypothetical protein